MSVVVGIDPGVRGAGAALDEGTRGLVYLFDTPVLAVVGPRRKSKPTMRLEYVEDAMAAELEKIRDDFGGIRLVVIEKVTPMPSAGHGRPGAAGGPGKESARSSNPFTDFGLGRGMGIWEGICAGLKLPRERVSPVSWKPKIIGEVAIPKDTHPLRRKRLIKNAARLKAAQLFPFHAVQLARDADNGRAEAALIALYGHRFLARVAEPAPF
jgi:hypothetical protein